MRTGDRAFWSGLAVLSAALLSAAAQTVSRVAASPRVVADLHGPDQPGPWDYAAVDAGTGRLLVARMNGVQTVMLAGNRAGLLLAAGRHVHAVLPLPDNRVLFTNGDIGMASLVDGSSGALLANFRTGVKPDAAMFLMRRPGTAGHGWR